MDDDGTGMRHTGERLFLVDAHVLPETLVKVAAVNELLRKGQITSVGEATRLVGISRSAYYRYKDHIRPFSEAAHQRIVNLSMELHHESGVLSSVLGSVALHGGNVLTINQGLPSHGTAMASMSIDTSMMSSEFEQLLEALRQLYGVKSLDVVGKA